VLTPEAEAQVLKMKALMDVMTRISVKELEGTPLSEEEEYAIENIGYSLEAIITDFAKSTGVTKLEGGEEEWTEDVADKEGLKTTIVADVHTDGNTEQVLEEGSGKLDWVLVINQDAEGNLLLSVGPVFTYYEFAHPMSDRLTDEAWQELLEGPDAPGRPEWIKPIY